MPRQKKNRSGEEEGLYRDNDNGGVVEDLNLDGPAPEDMYAPDMFTDEADARGTTSEKSPIIVRRRKRWKLCAGLCLCLTLVLVALVVIVTLGKGGGGDNNTDNDGVAPSQPSSPSAPTPTTPTAPTPTAMPTITAMPTRSIFWDLTLAVTDAENEDELMGSAVDVSADGSVIWIGAFNYTSPTDPTAVGIGRIRRIDAATGAVLAEVYGDMEGDSLGYQVCGSADGEFVASFTSRTGMITVWDYLSADEPNPTMRAYAQSQLPPSWDYVTVIYDFSKDGRFLAITGTDVVRQDTINQVPQWKLQVYTLLTGAGGSLAPYGSAIVLDEDLGANQPQLYALDMTEDGSVIAAAIVGVEGTQGRIRVYRRQANGEYVQLGADSEPLLISQIAEDDFYGRRLQVRVLAGQVWLAIGWEFRNTVLLRRWTGTEWVDGGELTPPGDEFSNQAEFGYDIDMNADGSRIAVGVRGFNNFQGATQIFELNGQYEWEALGQIVVGYENTFLGEAVAMSADGNTVVMGAPEDCSETDVCGGGIYVYTYRGPDNAYTYTAAPAGPTVAPAPTASPVGFTPQPTLTSAPTYDFSWSQINGVFDTIDQELFAAAVSMSSDGDILYVGAFENGEQAPESGRVVRIDLSNNNAEIGFYGDAYDFLGFDVSSNGVGNRVVGYLSSTSTLEVADYTLASGLQQSSLLETNFNSTSATFALSDDGNWLVGVGVLDPDDGGLGKLVIKTFQYTGSNFVEFGNDITLEEMDIAPTLDIHLTHDGSFMALAVAGWNSYNGKVRIYARKESDWEQLGTDIDSTDNDDFFGKTIRIVSRTVDNVLLLFVSAPYRNEVLVYEYSGLNWVPYGQPIQAGEEFTAEDEFGFDIDVSDDGNRIVVGVRCYDLCRGAVQTFEYVNGQWLPIGQIIAGFADSYFGEAVVCSGDCTVIAVGAPEDCSETGCGGSVYVFAANDNRS